SAPIVPHTGQSTGHELASSPAVHVPSPHANAVEPVGPRNASSDACVPFQRFMSTPPVMPGTVPDSEYCQRCQVGHCGAMFGHGAVVYCACQSGCAEKSAPPTLSR